MTTDTDTNNSTERDFDWNNANWPKETRFLYYTCTECGSKLAASPRARTGPMPSLYCDCEEKGLPYRVFAVKTSDGLMKRPGYENEEVSF